METKNLFLGFVLSICFSLTTIAQKAPEAWQQKTNLPGMARYMAFSFTIGNKAYVGGGRSSTGAIVKDMWEYDPSTYLWTKKADYPGGGCYAAVGFAIGNIGYVGLTTDGSITHKELYSYDPSNDTWILIGTFPGKARYAANAFVIGQKAYIVGGSPGGPPYLSEVYEFNSTNGVWTKKTSLPGNGVIDVSAFSNNNFGYVCAGFNSSRVYLNALWQYDPIADTWSSKTKFPGTPRSYPINFVIGDKAYLGCGSSTVDNVDFYEYNFSQNQWTKKPDFPGTGRYSGRGFSIGKKGYFVAGYAVTSRTYFNDIYEFFSDASLVTSPLPINNLCGGSAVQVAFEANTIFNSGNIFIAQLSNATGSFADPVNIGSLTGTVSDVITASMPTSILIGTGYRIRVISTNPVVIGLDNGINLSVNPSPSITTSPSEATINSGGSITITSSGTNTYSWAPTEGLNPATGNTVTASPLISTTYTVSGADANGCTNFNTVSITVNPFPTVTVSTNSPVICIGNSAELIAGGADSYTWLPETGLNIANEANVFASPTETTTYTVVGTNSFGLSAEATITITVNPIPIISLNASSTEICRGASVLLTASGLDNNSGYTWLPAIDLDNANGAGVTANPPSSTSYTVTGTDVNGCTNTTSTNIIVHGPSSLFLTSNSNICKGSSINLIASVTGEGLTTYSWAPADGLNTNAGSAIIASPENTTEYTVTATNENNCVNQATTTVTVNTTPSANAGADKTICGGANTLLTASSSTGDVTYFWSPLEGLSDKYISSPIASPAVSTTYTVSVSNGLCSARDEVTISVDPAPRVSITVTPETTNPGGNLNTIYTGYGEQSLTLSANTLSNVTYQWNPSTGGLSCTNCLTTIASPLTDTTYTLTATGSNGCTTERKQTILVVNIKKMCPG